MKKIKNILLKISSLLIILYLVFIQPLPIYIESPGAAFNLDEMIEINHQLSKKPGSFYLTTISIQQATIFTSFFSVLPFRDLIKEKDLFGEIEDLGEYNKVQKIYMESSINNAIKVAFDQAEKDYKMEFNGIYVMQVTENSDFFNTLRIGDIIKSIDGHYFQSANEFIAYIQEKNENETVLLEYERNGKINEVSGKTTFLASGKIGIGIGLTNYTKIKTSPEVTIHSGTIGGPSAGLMFALEIYNQLNNESFLQIYNIAGTGTISEDGTVGRIGGAAKKVIAADKKDIDYFFVPNDEITEEMKLINPEIKSNYDEALEAAEAISTEMKIIPVKTINDAIVFLESLNQEQFTKSLTWNLMNSYITEKVI